MKWIFTKAKTSKTPIGILLLKIYLTQLATTCLLQRKYCIKGQKDALDSHQDLWIMKQYETTE